MVLLTQPSELTSPTRIAREGTSHAYKCIDPLGDGSCFLAISPKMHALRQYAEVLAKIYAPILITGEVGSGKETVARLIHALSKRSANPFVAVTCAAMGGALQEEWFGSTPGVGPPRLGKVEGCQHGTLFLSDIAEMPLANQAELMHILKKRRLPGNDASPPAEVDVRILAATDSPLEYAVTEHTLRSDLYYSLSAFVLHVPPLRERPEDIPYLVEHFLQQEATHFELPVRRLSSAIMSACEAHVWPGNVRQLQNVIRQYAVLGDEQLLLKSLEQNSTYGHRAGESDPGRESRPGLKSLVRVIRDKTERDLVVSALEETGWNRKLAAHKLNISYRGLLYKIEEHRLVPPKKGRVTGHAIQHT